MSQNTRNPRMSYIFNANTKPVRLKRKRGRDEPEEQNPNSNKKRNQQRYLHGDQNLRENEDYQPTTSANSFNVQLSEGESVGNEAGEISLMEEEVVSANVQDERANLSCTEDFSSSGDVTEDDLNSDGDLDSDGYLESENDTDHVAPDGNDDVPAGLAHLMEEHTSTSSDNESSTARRVFTTDDEPFNGKLHPSLAIKKVDVMFALLNIFTRHKLTNVALTDILLLINLIVGFNSLPNDYNKFSDFFSSQDYTKEYICENCFYYIGKTKKQCSVCQSHRTKYFIILNVLENMKQILARNWNRICDYKSSLLETNLVTDIVNAAVIKTKNLKNSITLALNTNGVKIFNSSTKKSFWPILLQINELPPNLKFLRKNIIIAGLWLAEGEPEMDVFLKPLIPIFKKLFSDGLDIGVAKVDSIRVVACCVDTKARCKVQAMKQFNGYDGCGYCFHPGDLVGKQIRYGFRRNVELRTHRNTIQAMQEAHSTGVPVRGVKGISPLLRLPEFDVIRNVPVDYMHCVLLGVCKHLCSLWFDKSNRPWYIKRYSTEIDDVMCSIHPFVEISRRARKISERASWKANEWLHWLIHFSVVVLNHRLPDLYLNHYLLLVTSITALLQNSISQNTFEMANNQLQKFVREFENLYGLTEMTYNIHLLTHLAPCAMDYGPLWAFSLFVFEDLNGIFKSFVKGPKEPVVQIAKRCVMQAKINNCNNFCVDQNVIEFCTKINSSNCINTKHSNQNIILDESILNPYNNEREFTVVSRLKFNNYIFKPFTKSTWSGKQNEKRPHNDCFFCINDRLDVIYGRVHEILSNGEHYYFLFKPVFTDSIVPFPEDQFLKVNLDVDDSLYMIQVNDTVSKYVAIGNADNLYLTKIMYKLHVD